MSEDRRIQPRTFEDLSQWEKTLGNLSELDREKVERLIVALEDIAKALRKIANLH